MSVLNGRFVYSFLYVTRVFEMSCTQSAADSSGCGALVILSERFLSLSLFLLKVVLSILLHRFDWVCGLHWMFSLSSLFVCDHLLGSVLRLDFAIICCCEVEATSHFTQTQTDTNYLSAHYQLQSHFGCICRK